MPLTPVPESSLNHILDELMDAYLEFGEVSEEMLRQAETMGLKSRKSQPVAAYTVLGAVACFRNDVEQMHRHHKNAMRLSPGDFLTIYNYCVSLSVLELYSDALARVEEAIDIHPDLSAIDLAIEAAIKVGDDVKKTRFYELRKKLYGDADLDLSENLSMASEVYDNFPDEVESLDETLYQQAEELLHGIEPDK